MTKARFIALLLGGGGLPLLPKARGIVKALLFTLGSVVRWTYKTVTGSLLHITDALAGDVSALSVDIRPVQSGSGDPAPDNVRPISGWTQAKVTRTGKNLLTVQPVLTPVSATLCLDFGKDIAFASVVLSFKANSAIATGGTNSALIDFRTSVGTHNYVTLTSFADENGQHFSSSNVPYTGRFCYAKSNVTFRYVYIYYESNSYASFASDSLSEFQLEIGDTFTSYDPIDNQLVKFSFLGKNIFTGEFLQGYWAFANGGWVDSSNWIATEKIPCKPSTYYTVSASEKMTRYQGFVWYAADGSYISTDNSNANANIGMTKQSPANAAYLVFNIAGYPNTSSTISPSDVSQFQIEEGQTATAYEAPNIIYGGTLDVLTGVLTVDKVAVTIDGDTLKANDIYSFSPNVRTKTNYPAGLTGKYNSASTFCLSDKLKPNYSQVIGNPANATELCVYPHSSGIMVTFLASTGVTTKALADAWFAENTPMVCYELATPITVQLDPETLSTLAGENCVWADTGDTTMTYMAQEA